MRRTFELPTRISAAIGAAGLAFMAWQAWDVAAFLSRSVRAEGVIVDEQQHPTIRFRLPDGQPVDFVQNGFVSRPNGAPIAVVYEPGDPAGTAVADTFFPLWWTALGPLPATLLFIGAALAGWRIPIHVTGF